MKSRVFQWAIGAAIVGVILAPAIIWSGKPGDRYRYERGGGEASRNFDGRAGDDAVRAHARSKGRNSSCRLFHPRFRSIYLYERGRKRWWEAKDRIPA